MNSSAGRIRRAALAAFLLFAAVLLLVAPAEASVPRNAGIDQLDADALASLEQPPLASVVLTEPCGPVESSPRFGLGEDLSVFDTTNAPGSLGLCGLETRRCAITYARNNPLKYVDPDGREVKYATPALAVAFKSVISQYPAVQEVFDLYSGPGAPDLNIGLGTPERDPDGFSPPAAFSADIFVDPATGYDWGKMNLDGSSPVLPDSGQFLVKAELKSGSIVVSPDFLSASVSGGKASKQFAKVAVHEMAHAKHAATDPVDYSKLRAKDMMTNPDGSPIKHDKRKIEKKANDYTDRIVR